MLHRRFGRALMTSYAVRRGRVARQVFVDAAVVVWVVAWVLLARVSYHAVALLARPAEQTETTVNRLRDSFGQAAEQAGRVPGVGSDLRRPFESAADSLRPLATSAGGQADDLHRLAVLVGALVAAIPVLIVVGFWLPRRIRFGRATAAARRYLDGPADLDLFALRAMANQPLAVVAAIHDDPVRAWRDGDPVVIRALAQTELHRLGLRLDP